MIFKTMRDWLSEANTVKLSNYRYGTHSNIYLGYLTDDKQVLLAKVIGNMGLPQVLKHYGLTTKEQLHQLHPNLSNIDRYKIQLGSGVGQELIVPRTDLFYKLPFPFNEAVLQWYWTNYTENGSKLSKWEIGVKMEKWIITEKIFQSVKQLCFKCLFYAKTGNWITFSAEIKCLFSLKEHAPASHQSASNYFFDGWSTLDEAIAHQQVIFATDFWNHYHARKYGSDIDWIAQKAFQTAAIHGNLRFFEFVQQYFRCCDTVAHLAIIHKHHNMLKMFVRECTRSDIRSALLKVDDSTSCNVLGTCIMRHDFEALKMLQRLSYNNRFKKPFAVDNIAFGGNTAIQTAFIFCGDNFEMLEFLLNKHNPNFDTTEILKNVDAEDPNLVYRKEKKFSRYIASYDEHFSPIYRYREYFVDVRDRLKVSLTNKPDSEGYTIDERISQCLQSKKLTEDQCQKLSKVLAKKRRDAPQAHWNSVFW